MSRRPPGISGTTAVGQLAHPPQDERVISPDEDAWDALTQMLEARSPRLLGVRNNRLEGVIGQEARARLVQRKLRLGPR